MSSSFRSWRLLPTTGVPAPLHGCPHPLPPIGLSRCWGGGDGRLETPCGTCCPREPLPTSWGARIPPLLWGVPASRPETSWAGVVCFQAGLSGLLRLHSASASPGVSGPPAPGHAPGAPRTGVPCKPSSLPPDTSAHLPRPIRVAVAKNLSIPFRGCFVHCGKFQKRQSRPGKRAASGTPQTRDVCGAPPRTWVSGPRPRCQSGCWRAHRPGALCQGGRP